MSRDMASERRLSVRGMIESLQYLQVIELKLLYHVCCLVGDIVRNLENALIDFWCRVYAFSVPEVGQLRVQNSRVRSRERNGQVAGVGYLHKVTLIAWYD